MIRKQGQVFVYALRGALLTAAAFLLYVLPLSAAFTVSAITPSTINIIAGQTLSLNFTYASDTANRQIGYFVALSTQCPLRVGNTPGQDIIVSDAGVNVLVPAGQVNGGRQVGCGTQCTANTPYQISGIEGGQLPITIPINYPTGAYYIIVAVADWNIYLNPSIGTNSNMCVLINVTAPTPTYTYTPTFTPTGVQNVGLSDFGYTNHVAYIMYTGTPSPTFTVTQTYTRTMTNTFTATNTQTPTFTVTASPTFTYTSTDTSTLTDTATYTSTATDTTTYTKTATPTNTPTSTATKTFTPSVTSTNTISSDTPTYTPTFTQTFTATPTYSVTLTYTSTLTNTYTSTDTTTYTPTSTFTDTPTDTPTYTVTFTFTDTPIDSPTDTPTVTPTFTASPTYTVTFTATPTFTQSDTSTATPTFTGTPSPSATRTFTPTFTQSNTSTFSPTYSATPTSTYTFTDTPTFTQTYTSTTTPTIIPTPAPYPYLLEIDAYNEAGEKVRTIAVSEVSNIITDVTTMLDGSPSSVFVPGGNSAISIDFSNMTSPGQPTAGNVIFTWNGETDSGQLVAPGVYYIKITDIDTYAHVNTKVLEVQVMFPQKATLISIYNSAGELVQRAQQAPLTGALKLTMQDVFSIGALGDNIPINYGPGAVYNWDGKNAHGELVGSGIYEVQIQTFLLNSTSVTVSKSINILNGGKNDLISNQKAFPNPYVLSSGNANATIAWQAGSTGTMDIKIYNVAGEIVKAITTTLEAGQTAWDLSASHGGGVSSGIYVIILEARSITGFAQVKKIKFAIIKQVRDDDVIN